MAKYTVNFYVSGGTSGRYEGYTSKTKAEKTAREMALGNCPKGQRASWSVYDEDGNIVKHGTLVNE